jgi:hypothetical protein
VEFSALALFWPVVFFTRVVRWGVGNGRNGVMTQDPKTSRRVRSLATAPPRGEKCSCDGDGWIVTLDRGRYRSPGDPAMLRYKRCLCSDDALSQARSGVAGVA